VNRFGFFFVEAARSLRKNFATTLAATVTVLIVMYLFGVGAAFGSYIFNYAEKVRSDVTLKVWVADGATEAQKVAIQQKLIHDPRVRVETVHFVTREQAYADAKRKYKPELFNLLTGNPFPAHWEAKARNASQTAAVAASLRGLPGLERSTSSLPNPDYGSKTADRVLSTASAIEAVIAVIAVVLAIASVLLIGNTIRLSIFARRREVEVMKLVGATNWFVRWPFMLEGMICGLLGALGATAVLYISYEAIKGWLVHNTFSTASGASGISFQLLAVLLVVAGVALGAAGSGLTMRKFLRV
jgi:cell division transport system permease protein